LLRLVLLVYMFRRDLLHLHVSMVRCDFRNAVLHRLPDDARVIDGADDLSVEIDVVDFICMFLDVPVAPRRDAGKNDGGRGAFGDEPFVASEPASQLPSCCPDDSRCLLHLQLSDTAGPVLELRPHAADPLHDIRNRHDRLLAIAVLVVNFCKFVKKTGFLESAVQAFFTLRSEEHTSELQSRENLVCRLLLEKKKKK